MTTTSRAEAKISTRTIHHIDGSCNPLLCWAWVYRQLFGLLCDTMMIGGTRAFAPLETRPMILKEAEAIEIAV